MSRISNIWGVLDESRTYGAECIRKVAIERRVAGAIMFLVNDKDLQIEFDRVLHEKLLVPVLMYGSEIMLWKEEEKSRIMTVKMDSFRGLLGIRRMDSPKCTNKGVVRSEERSR